MRSRPLMAVLAMGLAITSCSQPDSSAVETLASTLPPASSVTSAEPASTEAAPSTLVVAVDDQDGTGEATATASDQSTDEADGGDTSDPSATSTSSAPPTTAGSTPSTTPSTAPATTITPTTASTTTAAPSTTAPTTAPPSTSAGAETRPEILRLTLPTFGGGSFDTNSVAGKNVILWFWGAY